MRARGFTLLEVIVVVAIIAMISGLVVPVAGTLLRQAKTDDTLRRLEQVAEAVRAYFHDTRRFPARLDALASDDGVRGWSGPYLTPGYVSDQRGAADLELDGFGTELALKALDASTLRIRSLGPDRRPGGGDDLDVIVNVVPVRREATLRAIDVWNAAILAYNRGRGDGTPPLPLDLAAALRTLAAAGYLPFDETLLDDAWGDRLVPAPRGRGPLVAVASKNIGAAGR